MTTFLLPASPITSLDEYLATDVGGVGVETAQRLGPRATIELIIASGLRGRGGGGFPTGRKWAGIADQRTRHYLVCNGAEGEPGTFKDRALLRANPYQVVEGLIIAAFAVGAEEAFICLKASFEREIAAVTRAVQEFQTAGICTDCTVTIVAGPDEYLFGEEKAMLEVIEGKPPLPRWFPPYEHGLFAASPAGGLGSGPARRPPPNRRAQPDAWSTTSRRWRTCRTSSPTAPTGSGRWAPPSRPGTVVATVVGDVVAPDVGEIELGTPLRAVIDAVGSGVAPGRSVKAVFSGVANPVVTAADLDIPVSYEGFAAVGSGMGAAGFIVHDDTACMVDAAYRLSRFLSIESCGQCPPCKIGSGEITARLERIETGAGDDRDIAVIGGWLERVTDGNRCYLAVEEQRVVSSVLRAFPEEFAEHLEQHRARGRRRARSPSCSTSPTAAPPTTSVLAQAPGLDLRHRVSIAALGAGRAEVRPEGGRVQPPRS